MLLVGLTFETITLQEKGVKVHVFRDRKVYLSTKSSTVRNKGNGRWNTTARALRQRYSGRNSFLLRYLEGGHSQSIKCFEWEKIFKNTALANFHAEKNGHDQFEESTEEVRATSFVS